jgi:hypothetical protein
MEMASVDRTSMIKALTSLEKFSETFGTASKEDDNYVVNKGYPSSGGGVVGGAGGGNSVDRWSHELEDNMSDEESQMIV